ncbi:zinc-binding dehydrogenase [Microtetraspora sp. NBRC 16547]|uniref:zinc-binding dehydrogenase n=1 Tax=Microtetraspora sp. NBRC 16547 TaxID=3030993 RepID=UPI0024A13346|nr:zinc-binding dehydrogenase [Microtetraspora sp. NBRC 16547]GLW97132.1 alcohol dehydrogenase [Microtetraspora sp. NBRC 16547]
MRALVQTAFGGPEAVGVQRVPDPEPGPHDVIVQVAACALNRLDLLQRRGPGLLPGFSLPHIAGMDIAGHVVATGASVTSRAVGDRVVVDPTVGCGSCPYCRAGERGHCASLRVIGGNAPGGYAEFVAVPAGLAHPVPEHVGLDEAATLPTPWSTAWQATYRVGEVGADDCVVIQAAASSVSIAAIQLAKRAGARVVAVASTDEKLATAADLGADLLLRGDAPIDGPIRDFTGGRGADVVLDHVGAATWQRSLDCLRVGGRMVMFGNTTGDEVSFSLASVYHRGLRLLGAGAYAADDFPLMLDAYFSGGLRTVLAAECGLEDLHAGFGLDDSRALVGRVLVRP